MNCVREAIELSQMSCGMIGCEEDHLQQLMRLQFWF
jgi:hypothetical protein